MSRNDKTDKKPAPALPQLQAAIEDIEMMHGRAGEHRSRAAGFEAEAVQTVMGAERQANELVARAQEEAAKLVREAQEQAAAHVAQANGRAAQLREQRDQETGRAEYWSGLAAGEAVKAGLPPTPSGGPETVPPPGPGATLAGPLGSPSETLRDALPSAGQNGAQPS